MEPTISAPTQDVSASATQSSSQSSAPKKHSCAMCQQRKVKCDRQYPCSACERGRATCVYRTPPPPRRRKGRRELVPSAVTEVNLIARLKRYEELLTNLGVNIENGDTTQGVGSLNICDESPLARRTGEMIRDSERQYIADEYQGTKTENIAARTGNLVSGDGKSRLFESHMWASLSDEFRDSKEMLHSSSEDEGDETPYGVPDLGGSSLIFGVPAQNTNLCSLHPSPVYIFKLWQAFLDNFNPLVKILHVPTFQPLILEAAGNLENLSKAMEALLFAIYSSAVTTMSSAECESLAGEPKSTLLARYHAATKMALISAGFLKSSDVLVLKAYVLFLLSTRNVQDSRSLWTLTGIAVRIGQRLGLHRDGEVMNLPIFETEMRRRMWWQIIVLDTQAAELSGSGASVLAHLWDTKIPLNLNDSDLYPQMTESPIEHTGPTEMMFCKLRYQVGEFFRTAKSVSVIGGSWHSLSDLQIPVAEKDKAISEIEKLVEDKFLRYCDPAIPLHLLTSIVARAVVCQLRVLAHHPSRRPGGEGDMSANEINLLFTNSLKTIEYDNLAQSSTNIRRFLWHVDVHFQWLAFVYLLSQLRCRTIGEEADRAWQQVGETFHNRPEIITDSKNALHTAIRSLTIRAWEARVAASGGAIQYRGEESLPEFISLLYARRTAIKGEIAVDSMTSHNLHRQPTSIMRHMEQGTTSESSPTFQQNCMPVTSGYPDSSAFDNLSSDHVGPLPRADSFSPMDWAQWDDLIRNHEL